MSEKFKLFLPVYIPALLTVNTYRIPLNKRYTNMNNSVHKLIPLMNN